MPTTLPNTKTNWEPTNLFRRRELKIILYMCSYYVEVANSGYAMKYTSCSRVVESRFKLE